MKKLINSPETVVTDALAGMAAAHPSLSVDIENKVVIRADAPTAGKVGLVSGGGSGHEPLHAGFVGYGMLDAACAGEVFTSPVPDQIVIATTAVSGGAGVLHVVKNYTGDVLNFQMAAELVGDEGIEVTSVVVNDDVAVQDSLYTAGRRGVGATVFVEKIAGALAERRASLPEVAAVAAEVNERSRSFGVARFRPRESPRSSCPTRRSSSASASTASRAVPGRCLSRPARSSRSPWTPSTPTCRFEATCSSWSTAWAAPR
jgi:phosphoenolpyruvate---glycerone phosphotransferase subunit DhaK